MAEIMIFTADQADRSIDADEEELPPLAFQTHETEDSIELRADVTGFDDDEIEVTLAEGELTVTGYHEEAEDEEGDATGDAASQSGYGFTQSFAVPEGLSTSQIAADIVDGLLTIVIDKRPRPEDDDLH